MAGELSFSKPFLKKTKTNSLFLHRAQIEHRTLSHLSDISRVGAKAGITTGAILSGPSLASWFLNRKLSEWYKDTLDQSDWCLMFLCNQAWISFMCLPEPRANRKHS